MNESKGVPAMLYLCDGLLWGQPADNVCDSLSNTAAVVCAQANGRCRTPVVHDILSERVM